MHVIVVGAGIVGLSVAGALSARGARVTVLDAGQPGGGLTTTTYAWINAGFQPVDRAYWELRRAAVDRWHADHADPAWFHPGGSLHREAPGEAETTLHEWAATLRTWGEDIEELDSGAVADLEPDLAGPGRWLWFRRDAWVDSASFVRHHVDLLSAAGVMIRSGTPVVRLSDAPDPPGVVLAAGGDLGADIVVVAAARATDALAHHPGVRLRPPDGPGVPGLLVLTTPTPARLGRIVRAPDAVLRPAPGARLLLQAADQDAALRLDEPAALTRERVATLLARAVRALPAAGGLVRERTWLAARAMPADGLPIVGWLDPGRAYVVVTHSGVILAPELARIAADEIIDDRRHPTLDRYRPRTGRS